MRRWDDEMGSVTGVHGIGKAIGFSIHLGGRKLQMNLYSIHSPGAGSKSVNIEFVGRRGLQIQ